MLTFPEEVVLLLLDDEEGVFLSIGKNTQEHALASLVERGILRREEKRLFQETVKHLWVFRSPRYIAVDGKARHETGTRFSKLNNLPMNLMREEIHTGVLIFIPAGYGDMRTFRDIVARLDDDRPIYGLWPPKAGLVEGLRNKPVHWLVSAYIAEIRRVQPAGPYHLSGYSAGGLAMTAVARELVRQGDTVDALILFDPPVYIPRWIDLWFKIFYNLCNLTPLTDAIRWTLIRRWDSRLLRWVSDEGLCTHVSVLHSHDVGPYPGRITYFLPRRSWIRLLNLSSIGKSWRKTARGGLDVHWMSGYHHEMMRGSQTELIADGLRDCLERSGRP